MIADETRSAGPGVLGGVVILDPATRKPIPPGHITLVDPETGEPYKAGVTVQQVEGGFDPTGLSTEEKQDAILAALDTLTAAIQAGDLTEVTVTDDALPPVEGQATATKQDQILSALQALTTLLVDAATFREDGTQAVSLESTPLPVGAATADKQDAIRTAVEALADALSQTLNVAGTVSVEEPLTVEGSVAITNSDIAVKPAPGATYPVTVEGASTAAKQDSILAALGNLLTALQAPQPITDNGGSITVDGSVGISGTVPVSVAEPLSVSQSGTWTVMTQPGASATSAALTSFRNGSVSTSAIAVKNASGRVYQYTAYNASNVVVFLHFYDALAANVTAGTTVPKMTYAIPAGSTLDGYWSISHGFSTGISISASTAWAGTGAPASALAVTLGYA